MFAHNLKLAVRQLLKYRLQSAVSIVSLAIGFACFSLAAMWIRYEMTYDAFHKDAEDIYVLMGGDSKGHNVYLDPRTLRELPQLEQLTHVCHMVNDTVNGTFLFSGEWLMNDTNFVSLFGMEMLEGGTSFLYNEHEVAVSDQLAKKLWGNESPIGKEINTVVVPQSWRVEEVAGATYRRSRTVAAVFRHWGAHSNFRFDLLGCMPQEFPQWYLYGSYLMSRISPRVDLEGLNARLDTIPIYTRYPSARKNSWRTEAFPNNHIKALPITRLRHVTDDYKMNVKTQINHIYLFSIAGGLLVFCGVLNYLTIFLNRLFIRKREIALRTVFGASGWKLTVQFLIEYGLLLAIALLLGSVLVEWSLDEFYTMTGLPRDKVFFYRETTLFLLLVAGVSLLVSLPPIGYFRRQSLQSSIAGTGGLARYNLFRRISTGVQIAVSLFCIFCTVVMMKQIDTLRHGDIGFERENRMVYGFRQDFADAEESVASFLKQCPEVDTVVSVHQPLYPILTQQFAHLSPEQYPDLNEEIKLGYQYISEGLADFYGLTLVQGRWLNAGETGSALVNETLVRRMGWENPLEETIQNHSIVGVVKDFQNVSPTARAESHILLAEEEDDWSEKSFLLVRSKPGRKQALKDKIEAFYKENGIPRYWCDLTEEYNRLLTSERNLQKLLTITTSVCILIALFGVWSMIMLTCEQRRKEIAVRKVHGATVGDILRMFFGEYMALLGVAAVVAFPVGYVCMKPWLEQYVVQTEISWWIYAGILAGMALLVSLCIGWRVWKAANSHPADEICKG